MYDRRAGKFRGMERTLAWYFASLEGGGNSTHGPKNATNITSNLRCMLRICRRTGGSSRCYFGIRMVHEHRGTHRMIGQANSWHTRDLINSASGIALRTIRRCGCGWMMILQTKNSTCWCFGLTLPPLRGLVSDMQGQSQCQSSSELLPSIKMASGNRWSNNTIPPSPKSKTTILSLIAQFSPCHLNTHTKRV